MELNKLTGHLTIPVGTEEIRERAYNGNHNIRSVTIPGTVKVIGQRAFADCANLREVTLCEGVEEIRSNAFTDCPRLKSIRLPASIRHLTGWAFYESGLQLPVLSASGHTLYFCPAAAAGTDYTVPDGVRDIGMQAFIELKDLQRVIFPDSLQIIRERAFIACGITSLSFPGGIRQIEPGAFYECNNLKTMTGWKEDDPVDYADAFWRIQGRRLTMPCHTDLPRTPHWEEAGFQRLARRCAQADAAAMYELAEYFRKKALVNRDTAFYAGAANFWLYRSYQYGGQQAKQTLTGWIKDHPGQQLRTLQISNSLGGSMEGTGLNALGFLAFHANRSYTLHCVDDDGLVLVDSYESDDGPDEDGFGREEYYDWWFFDSCLNPIPDVPFLHGYSYNEISDISAQEKLHVMHEQAVRLVKKRGYLGDSRYITAGHIDCLRAFSQQAGLDPERQYRETDPTRKMEGLYLKIEEGGQVVARMKYVRATFSQCVDVSGTHWIERPILPNQLCVPVERLFHRGLHAKG